MGEEELHPAIPNDPTDQKHEDVSPVTSKKSSKQEEIENPASGATILDEDEYQTSVEKISGIEAAVEADVEEHPAKDEQGESDAKEIVAAIRKRSVSVTVTTGPQASAKVDTRASVPSGKREQLKEQLVSTQLRRSLMSLRKSVVSQKALLEEQKSEPNHEEAVEAPEHAEGATVQRKSVVIFEGGQVMEPGTEVPEDKHSLQHRESYDDTQSFLDENFQIDLEPRMRRSHLHDEILKSFKAAAEEDDEIFKAEEAEPEEEEEAMVEEEIYETLDREPYYEKYDYLQTTINYNIIKSFILQKKISHYLARRKMEHVLEEDTYDKSGTAVSKYEEKLEAYQEMLDLSESKRSTVSADIEALKDKSTYMKQNLEAIFKGMQNRELEIGYGLISTKTGNEIPAKVVERYIKRQKDGMIKVSTMLLKFLRLKYMVQEKLDAIAAIDEVSPGMFLTDYEILKTENRGHADKLEEKEELLTRLRLKCHSTIQILAHLRDKGSEMEIDLQDIREDVKNVDSRKRQVREDLNKLKINRDVYRQKINALRNEAGLLTYPTLLRDMEESQEEIFNAASQLDSLLESHKIKSKLIRNLRAHIENLQCPVSSSRVRSKNLVDKKNRFLLKKARKNDARVTRNRQHLLEKAEIENKKQATSRLSFSVTDPYRFSSKSMTSVTTVDQIQLQAIVRHLN